MSTPTDKDARSFVFSVLSATADNEPITNEGYLVENVTKDGWMIGFELVGVAGTRTLFSVKIDQV
jgi:nucleoside-triphosphatase THEP1